MILKGEISLYDYIFIHYLHNRSNERLEEKQMQVIDYEYLFPLVLYECNLLLNLAYPHLCCFFYHISDNIFFGLPQGMLHLLVLECCPVLFCFFFPHFFCIFSGFCFLFFFPNPLIRIPLLTLLLIFF